MRPGNRNSPRLGLSLRRGSSAFVSRPTSLHGVASPGSRSTFRTPPDPSKEYGSTYISIHTGVSNTMKGLNEKKNQKMCEKERERKKGDQISTKSTVRSTTPSS